MEKGWLKDLLQCGSDKSAGGTRRGLRTKEGGSKEGKLDPERDRKKAFAPYIQCSPISETVK